MGQEIQARDAGGDVVVVPGTGEVVALDAPTNELAAAIENVRELEQQLREAKRIVTDELLDRMRRAARWTYEGGGYKVTGKRPPAFEYDGRALRLDLMRLVREGVIDKPALDAAVEVVQDVKVRAAGVKALESTGIPEVLDVLRANRRPGQGSGSVSISRTR